MPGMKGSKSSSPKVGGQGRKEMPLDGFLSASICVHLRFQLHAWFRLKLERGFSMMDATMPGLHKFAFIFARLLVPITFLLNGAGC
jgi:hypothetical protein